MTEKPVKMQLIRLLDEGCSECNRLAGSLTTSEQMAQGTLEHWAARDMLFHLAYWIGLNARRQEAVRSGNEPAPEEEYLAVNDRVFEENKERSFPEAVEQVNQAYQALKLELECLSEEDLHTPGRYPWSNGRPLFRVIFSDIYLHPISHLAQCQIERGRLDEARRLSDNLAQATVALDDSPQSRGRALYNLACFHALCGEPGRAVELLGQAFPLDPTLVGWSKGDTDLVSLRQLPDFQALYN